MSERREMLRKLAAGDYYADDTRIPLEISGGFYLLFLNLASVLIVTMVLFACADGASKKRYSGGAGRGGWGGGAACGGGGGGGASC